jgi:F0F1-type ATP synthase assembly protein I
MDDKERGSTTALALVAQLGFSIAVPMVVFIGGGAWLDGQFHTAPWLLFLGIFFGLLSAGAALYQLAKVPTRRPANSPKPALPDSEKTELDEG